MTMIWKFTVPVHDEFTIEMPRGAQVLSVGVQYDDIVMWVKVNPEAPMVKKVFYLRGTGHLILIEDSHIRFIGTVQMAGGTLIWHVFEHVN